MGGLALLANYRRARSIEGPTGHANSGDNRPIDGPGLQNRRGLDS